MSIKRHVEWNGNQYTGLVNLGDDHSLPCASNAFVYILVPLKVGTSCLLLILMAGLSGCVLANLACILLIYLHES